MQVQIFYFIFFYQYRFYYLSITTITYMLCSNRFYMNISINTIILELLFNVRSRIWKIFKLATKAFKFIILKITYILYIS